MDADSMPVRDPLAESERRYRMLFAQNPLPMWMFDVETLRYLDVNDAAIRVYGYTREEFLSMGIDDIRPHEDVERLRRYMQTRDPALIVGTRWRHCRKDGTTFPVEVYSSDIVVDGREARLVLSIDISDRERAELAVQRLNDELEHRVRQRTAELEAAIAELESFSSSVSHDLRVPLRAIDGYARMLVEDHGEQLDDEARRMLGTISDNVRRMGQLINDLLALARAGRQPLVPHAVDMQEMATAAAAELVADCTVRPELHIGELPPAMGDAVLLRQVWMNLIDNAIKFSSREPAPLIEIGSRTIDGGTEYFVRDNGVGFDLEHASNLYGVFQRLHDAREFPGTGVGLAIVHRIITRHHGTITAESAPRRGATFSFTVGTGGGADPHRLDILP